MNKDKVMGDFQNLLKKCTRIFASYLEPLAEKYGISLPESHTLTFFYENPGLDCAAELVKMKGVSKGFASNMISALTSKGLIEIKRDENDRRVQHIILTEKALTIVEETNKVRKYLADELLDGITEEEFAFVEKAFMKITANAGNLIK